MSFPINLYIAMMGNGVSNNNPWQITVATKREKSLRTLYGNIQPGICFRIENLPSDAFYLYARGTNIENYVVLLPEVQNQSITMVIDSNGISDNRISEGTCPAISKVMEAFYRSQNRCGVTRGYPDTDVQCIDGRCKK